MNVVLLWNGNFLTILQHIIYIFSYISPSPLPNLPASFLGGEGGGGGGVHINKIKIPNGRYLLLPLKLKNMKIIKILTRKLWRKRINFQSHRGNMFNASSNPAPFWHRIIQRIKHNHP